MDIYDAASAVEAHLENQQQKLADWQTRANRLRLLARDLTLSETDQARLSASATPTQPTIAQITPAPPLGPPWPEPYRVVAIDGSETLLSHHEAYTLPFLSTASITLGYGCPSSIERTYHIPDLASPTTQELRQASTERELTAAAELAASTPPSLLLLDGSLIPWALLRLPTTERQARLAAWRTMVNPLLTTPLFGYISHSASAELVRAISALNNLPESATELLLDRHVVETSPAGLSPLYTLDFSDTVSLPMFSFAFLKTATELVRLEWFGGLPDWLPTALGLVIDQIEVGRGYPIALSEAHEQAIIRGTDRLLLERLEARFLRTVIPGSAKGRRKRTRGLA